MTQNDSFIASHARRGSRNLLRFHVALLSVLLLLAALGWKPLFHAVFPGPRDAIQSRATGFVWIAMGAPAVLLSAWNIRLALWRLRDITRHPIYSELAKFGPATEIAAAIDAQVAHDGTRLGAFWVTDSWLLQENWIGLYSMSLTDLVWMFVKVVEHRTEGVRTGRSCFANFIFRTGKKSELQMKPGSATRLLAEISRRNPWIVMGFNDATHSQWRENPVGLIATVDLLHSVFRQRPNSIPDPQSKKPESADGAAPGFNEGIQTRPTPSGDSDIELGI